MDKLDRIVRKFKKKADKYWKGYGEINSSNIILSQAIMFAYDEAIDDMQRLASKGEIWEDGFNNKLRKDLKFAFVRKGEQ